jgi:hypothetical protein
LPSFVVLVTSLAVAGVPAGILFVGLLVFLQVEEAASFLRFLKRVRAG